MTLEELLNKLIEKGWKPFGLLNEVESIVVFDGLSYKIEINYSDHGHYKYLRQIVSKESGLRQFVCENMMVKEDNSSIELNIMSEGYGVLTDKDYQYWILESALCDEDKLEEFLLQNIKVEG